MEFSEIKSWANTAVKTMWFIACLGLVYVTGKKVGEYLLTDSSEQLAKEIILAYKKTIPSWVDTLVITNNDVRYDTIFIDVMEESVQLQDKESSLCLFKSGNVVGHTQDVLYNMFDIHSFEVWSINELFYKATFTDILQILQQQQKMENIDYKTLQKMIENEEIESL